MSLVEEDSSFEILENPENSKSGATSSASMILEAKEQVNLWTPSDEKNKDLKQHVERIAVQDDNPLDFTDFESLKVFYCSLSFKSSVMVKFISIQRNSHFQNLTIFLRSVFANYFDFLPCCIIFHCIAFSHWNAMALKYIQHIHKMTSTSKYLIYSYFNNVF